MTKKTVQNGPLQGSHTTDSGNGTVSQSQTDSTSLKGMRQHTLANSHALICSALLGCC